jgi:winged helix DNA-binding protein
VRVAAGKGLRSNELRYVAVQLEEAEADAALAWLAGEYLRAFGPARVKDFTWWAGVTATRAKAALAEHDTVETDGYLLRARDLRAFEAAQPARGVDLIPKWD